MLYKDLPEDVCPFEFPLLLKDRDEVIKNLKMEKIHPGIGWYLPEIINKNKFKNSWDISSKILTIPISQRYSRKDLQRISFGKVNYKRYIEVCTTFNPIKAKETK